MLTGLDLYPDIYRTLSIQLEMQRHSRDSHLIDIPDLS